MLFRIIIAVFVVEVSAPIPATAQPGLHVDAGVARKHVMHSSTVAPMKQSLSFVRNTLRLLAGPKGKAARAGSSGSASRKVNGPVVFEMTIISGDLKVTSGAVDQVEIKVSGPGVGGVTLLAHGKRISPEFGLMGDTLRNGDVKLVLPPGSDVVIKSINGDVRIDKVGGDAQITAVSGDVTINGVAAARIEAVSGDVELAGVTGAVRVETVSGDTIVETVTRDDSHMSFETTSGTLTWSGKCGAGCRIEAETLSGDVVLKLDKKSSFQVAFESFSGDLEDMLAMAVTGERGAPGRGREVDARYGNGAGKISVETHSGSLTISKK